MLGEKLHPEDPSIPTDLIDAKIYNLTWRSAPLTEAPDMTGLPSLNHAIYLFNTVKFHLGQTYRLFDETEFENQIRNFYAHAVEKASKCRLWYTKFLLILAFGTAFLAPPTRVQEPPGSKFFVRAMSLMPDHGTLWMDSLLAIEVLALVGLYLFSLDERESAHIYVSQLLCLSDSLLTFLPARSSDSDRPA